MALIPSRAWGFIRVGLDGRYGVRADSLPTGGDFPALGAGTFESPGDDAVELVAVPATLPAQGELVVYSNNAYTHGPIASPPDPWTCSLYYFRSGESGAQEAADSPFTVTDGVATHAATGALVAQSATVAGVAVHPHVAAGVLAAQAATVAGSAARGSALSATGVLTAQSATVVGTAARLALHTAAGALVAQDATVAGTAAHIVVHAATGALVAGSAAVDGAAERSTAGAFEATGAMTAQAATVSGTAAHLTLHTAEGTIAAGPAVVSGSAAHLTLHQAVGALVAGAASVSGVAFIGDPPPPPPPPTQGGGIPYPPGAPPYRLPTPRDEEEEALQRALRDQAAVMALLEEAMRAGMLDAEPA